MRIHGFDETGHKKKNTYDFWIESAERVGDALKFMKWKIAAYYAANKNYSCNSSYCSENCCLCEKQNLPPCPSELVGFNKPHLLVGGKGYRWLEVLKRTDIKMFESFNLSILFSKKGMPRPDQQMLDDIEKKTFKKLTTRPDDQKDKLVLDLNFEDKYSNMIHIAGFNKSAMSCNVPVFLTQQTAKEQLVRTVQEIFVGETYTDEDRYEPFFPSTSANYNLSRSKGGAIGAILADKDLMKGLHSSEELISIETVGKSWRSMRLVVNDSKLRERWAILYNRILDKVVTEEVNAELLILPEALKGRGISKGPALHYTFLKPLQKKLWSVVKKHRCFELIGKPVDAWHVQQQMGSKLKEIEKFLSVDYSDATNEMYSWVSECIMYEIAKVLCLST